jgi:Right handed beta helix region
MDRRHLLAGLLMLPASSLVAERGPSTLPQAPPQSDEANQTPGRVAALPLVPSGPVTSRTDGQVIENLDVDARAGDAVTVVHQNVTVRNCRIRHAGGHGVNATGATGLVLQDIEIDHVGAPPSGVGPSQLRNNVNLESCPNTTIARVKASRGSSNIYGESSEGARMRFLELHDARGPMPRGQNVQLNQSPNSVVEDFSGENGPTSWTEDNVSVFRSNGCVVRRGLVHYNNSPTGDGVMIEGSFDCLVEDVDAVQQGNGAFAAVPESDAGSGGCSFLRCRTRATYNTKRDGRAAPSSNGVSIYTLISPGGQKHTVTDCHYDALANPRNLLWDEAAVNAGWSFTPRAFSPRNPIRLVFGW